MGNPNTVDLGTDLGLSAAAAASLEPEALTFGTYDVVPDMTPCVKKRIIVSSKKIDQPFRVRSLEGDYAQGKPGDYLMQGIDGEHYICDSEIYEKTYDEVSVPIGTTVAHHSV